jgi:hypothetical protein
MTPDKLRERRRVRIEKRRRAFENAALAAAMEGMFGMPTAKDLLLGMALVAAIFAVIVGPILFFTL